LLIPEDFMLERGKSGVFNGKEKKGRTYPRGKKPSVLKNRERNPGRGPERKGIPRKRESSLSRKKKEKVIKYI